MKTRITSFGDPGDGVNALRIGFAGHSPAFLSKAERDFPGNANAIKNIMRSRMLEEAWEEFWVHKNRDGTFTYAMGKEPITWPEDQN